MPVQYNNKLGEWVREVIGEMTLRQVEIRTKIAHTTIKNILDGRVPDPATLIRFAGAFHRDVPEALRLAGHDDIAEIWELGAAPQPEGEDNELSEDERELLLYYHGTAPNLQPKAKAFLKALMDDNPEDLPTFGKGKRARDKQ